MNSSSNHAPCRTLLCGALVTASLSALLAATPAQAAPPNAYTPLFALSQRNAPAQLGQPSFPLLPGVVNTPAAVIIGQIKEVGPGLRVVATAPDGTVLAQARTREEGFYKLYGLAPDASYEITVFDANQQPIQLTEGQLVEDVLAAEVCADARPPASSTEATPVALPLAQPTEAAPEPRQPRAPRSPNAVDLSGRVTAADTGAGLGSVSIYAYTRTTASRFEYVDAGFSSSNGNYTIFGLEPGTYYLSFETSTFGSSAAYLDEYYNDKGTLLTADAIVVGATNLTGIDATLIRGATLTGTLSIEATGAPLNSASVYAYTSTTANNYVANDFTSANGIYTLEGLVAGTYYLQFDAPFSSGLLDEWHNDKPTQATADAIVVTLGTTTTLSAALSRAAVITGTISDEVTGAPLGSVIARIYTSTTATNAIDSDFTGANGIYTFEGLGAGSYYLHFDAPFGGAYLDEWHNNKATQASADPVAITLNTTTTVNVGLARGAVISGTVSDEISGAPLNNVFVEAYTSTIANNSVASDFTGADGVYILNGLPAGNYYLHFDAPSNSANVDEWHNNKATQARADPVAATLNTTTTVNAGLARGGTLTGKITGSDGGVPLLNATVRLLTRCGSSTRFTNFSDATDANGIYTITGILSNTYFVDIDPAFSDPYVGEYFDNQTSLSQATPVQIALNQTLTANAELQRSAQIAGRVLGATGQPLAGYSVLAYLASGSSVSFQSSDSTDASGIYTITGLAPGNYKVEFDQSSFGTSDASEHLGEWYNDKPNSSTADVIAVAAGATVININAQLVRGAVMTGQVTGVGNAPLKDVAVSASSASQSFFNTARGTNTDASGAYTLTGLSPGGYRVRFSASSVNSVDYLDEYYNNTAAYNGATTVTVSLANVTANINAQLEVAGSIRGTVRDAATNAPIPNAFVSANSNTDSSNLNLSSGASTDASGNYTLTGLATGVYTVRFGRTGYFDQYYNNSPSFAGRTVVNVTAPNPTDNINATLNQAASLAGRVTDVAGNPLSGISVRAENASTGDIATASTTNDGTYRITGLVTGNYIVRFQRTDCPCDAVQYYSSKVFASNADAVLVTAPNTTNNIDATLPCNGAVADALLVRKRADSPRVNPGESNGYTLVLQNATQRTVTVNTVTDTLPVGFTYKPGSTTGAFAANPSMAGQVLVWSGAVVIPPLQQATFNFKVDVASSAVRGQYYANSAQASATADVGGLLVVPALNTAPVYVPPPSVTVGTSVVAGSGSNTPNPITGGADVAMGRGSRSSMVISTTAQCPTPPGGTPTNVRLRYGPLDVPMQLVSGNIYSYTINTSQIVNGDVNVVVTCTGGPITNTIATVRLYDPSGFVRDEVTKNIITNATVQLFKVPGFLPDSPEEPRDCRTVNTRLGGVFSQTAPTNLGVLADPLLFPPEIDPPVNPQKTNSIGRYGWNVAQGCWYVVVSAPGYKTKTSPLAGVPPEVTDLDVYLARGGGLIYLPLVRK